MPLNLLPEDEPWYKDGLRFKCTQCGRCCTGEPGYVWLTEEDIQRFLQHLQMNREAFLKRYTRNVNGRLSLIELKPNYDCVFLKENKCSAYEARPIQCRTFPWWKSTISNPLSWNLSQSFCEGINHPEGKLYTKEEIEQGANPPSRRSKEEP
ncbi:MAG: YkgJ family cysteine cluster protein [Simkaniaceae bacterium]|nr:YkgJ family cysteine cluster protein [Simkaniaceae bacterium]MCF7852113.1 YkgJ family cysteine cluster protein [Simkaniaceae bacterium]